MNRDPIDPERPGEQRNERHDDDNHDDHDHHDLADSEREAIHDATEDVAPGVIKDGHGEIQPDPYPDRPDDSEDDDLHREVIERHRADAHNIEEHRTSAANETLGTVVDHESDADTDTDHTGG